MNLESILPIIGTVCGAIGLVLSVLAYRRSGNAIDLSKKSLLIDKRPLVTVAPERSVKSGKYINIHAKGSKFRLKIGFKITNAGSSIASDVTTPHVLNLGGPEGWRFADIKYVPAPEISLAPGDSLLIVVDAELFVSNSTVPEKLSVENEQGSFDVTIELKLSYRSEHFPGLAFRTESKFKITSDQTQILRIEHITVPSELRV